MWSKCQRKFLFMISNDESYNTMLSNHDIPVTRNDNLGGFNGKPGEVKQFVKNIVGDVTHPSYATTRLRPSSQIYFLALTMLKNDNIQSTSLNKN